MYILRFLLIFLYLVLLTWLSWFLNGQSLFGIDDANIYMIYMRNFADGCGFVYNIGGERVEGFTSLLWTLIGAVFYKISVFPEYFMLVFNMIITAIMLNIFTIYLDSIYGNTSNSYTRLRWSIHSLFFLLIIGLTPGFIDWTVLSLMETGLWSALLMLIFLLSIQKRIDKMSKKHFILLNVIYIFLVLCRPEAIFIVPVSIGINLFRVIWETKKISSIAIYLFLVNLFVFLSAVALLTLWRLYYFGFPFPNTFYAKVSMDTIDNLYKGYVYLLTFFIQKPMLVVCYMFVFLGLSLDFFRFGNFNNFRLYAIVYGGTAFLIPLIIGGDHFGLHRFIIPFTPVFALIVIDVFSNLSVRLNIQYSIVILLMYGLSNEYNLRNVFNNNFNYPICYEWEIARGDRKRSKQLNDFFIKIDTLPSQGLIAAGGSAYAYKGASIDLLGLNNTRMAHASKIKERDLPKNHASFNSNVFFELLPDILWYYGSHFVDERFPPIDKLVVNDADFSVRALKNLHENPIFKQYYGYFCIIRNDNKVTLNCFMLRTFAGKMGSDYYTVNEIDFK